MSNFPRKTEKTAKSVDEAVNAALAELGVTRDMVEVDIIEEGSKGFLGFGAKDAKVCVTVKKDSSYVADEAVKAETAAENVPEKMPEVKKDITVNPERKDKAVKFLTEVFEAMKVDVAISAKINGDMLEIDLQGENMGIIIGKRGDTLDSLQYLTSLVVNHNEDDYVKVTIDTENYREKRTQALLQLSDRLAEKVAKSGRKYTLEPMNPYERRVIHSNLQEHEAVTTYSVGDEPYRKVVIAPKNPKPYNRERKPYSGRRRNTGGYKRGYAHDND